MNKDKFMLGVDIGTTSTKAVLYRETGEIITDENNGYALHTPDISTAEQDPEEIFQAVLLSIRNVMVKAKIDPSDLSFISFKIGRASWRERVGESGIDRLVSKN